VFSKGVSLLPEKLFAADDAPLPHKAKREKNRSKQSDDCSLPDYSRQTAAGVSD
jgi:hypothetical protein